jgi:paraquat-inducible protein B
MAPPDGEPRYVRMRFVQSLRGLSVGAPVDFVGVNIGQVFSLDLDYDAEHKSFPMIVTAQIYPRRMGKAYEVLEQQGTATNEDRMARLVGQLVARGLRAQPRTGNLLTGQLYIALDFIPGTRPARFDVDARPLEIPTVSGTVEELQQKLVSIVDKINRIPLGKVSGHFDQDLVDLDGTLHDLQTDLLPAGNAAFKSLHTTLGTVDHALADDAPWRDNIDQTLVEARSTLRSVRSLTDYLDRHPEAFIRGRHPSRPTVSEASTSATATKE